MYRKITSYGNPRNFYNGLDEYLSYCMIDDSVDSEMRHGSVGAMNGPYAPNCQEFMAEYGAKQWDIVCDTFYKTNKTRAYPNTANLPYFYNPELTMGEQLLRTAAERRYCQFKNVSKVTTKLNPLDPNSPIVYHYEPIANGLSKPYMVCNPVDDGRDNLYQLAAANPNACGHIFNKK